MTKAAVVVLKADSRIGTGHLMRVRGLLPYLEEFKFSLISDSFDPSLLKLCPEFKQLSVCKKAELATVIASHPAKLFIFDHYFTDETEERAARSHAKVVVIDDLANRRHCCDLLFDQGLQRQCRDYATLVNPDAQICCGAACSMVREIFASIPRPPLTSQRRVLVNYGGADPAGACLKCMRSVLKAGLNQEYFFEVIAGAVNPDFGKLHTLLEDRPNCSLRRHCSKIPELMGQCHLACGAYGGMFSERICAGLPALNTVVAQDNQYMGPEILKKYDLGIDLSLSELESPKTVACALHELDRNQEHFSQNCRALLDGQGLRRMAAAIKELFST